MDRNDFAAAGVLNGILGVIFGFVVAVLFYFHLLPLFLAVVWIAFAFATAVLLIIPYLFLFGRYNRCTYVFGKPLLFGAAGTLIASFAALSIPLVARLTAVAIVVFILAAFFLYLLFTIFFFINCLILRACLH